MYAVHILRTPFFGFPRCFSFYLCSVPYVRITLLLGRQVFSFGSLVCFFPRPGVFSVVLAACFLLFGGLLFEHHFRDKNLTSGVFWEPFRLGLFLLLTFPAHLHGFGGQFGFSSAP